MEVYGNIKTAVEIDPIDVITNLIDEEIGSRSWIFEDEKGKYFIGFEVSAGSHSIDDQKEISKECYDYVKSLYQVIDYIKNNK